MVQNKQKSNKINIIEFIACFILVVVFVFKGVSFTWAYPSVPVSKAVLDRFVNWELENSIDNCLYVSAYVGSNTGSEYIAFLDVDITKYNIVGFKKNNDYSGYVTYFFYLADDGRYHKLVDICNYKMYYDISSSSKSSWDGSTFGFPLNSDSYCNVPIYFSDIAPQFLTLDDVNSYMFSDDKKMADKYNYVHSSSSYDKNIPTPKALEVYFDRKLNKPFNLADLCNPLKIKWAIPEDSDYSDYTLDVQIDVNYNKLNSISGIGTKPTILQTGKVEFASCSATDKELNISATYDGWTKLSEKYQTSTWGLTGNYFDLWLRYKDSNGNYGNWVKVTINPDNSSTVIKAGLFDNGTNTTINKGYEEISGDNGEHVNGDYDNYYVNTSDENISNNLTSLKNNYSNLVSFYKELFSFLPAEIWIILIGLVSTMVIIAIIKFVRG